MREILEFGPFRLDCDAGLLFRGVEPLVLGGRAVALLGQLLASAGAPVSKPALMDAGWGDIAVEESNLTVQIAALRRALAGEGGSEKWIETLPRRGYRYVGPPPDARPAIRPESPPVLSPVDGPSIVVMPFVTLGSSGDEDYFAEGVVDDIITGLARIKWLFVIGRNSSFAHAGRSRSQRHLGREFGVRYVLEGSLRRLEGRVRISVRLLETASGMQIWAERYDRSAADIFALQDDIALSTLGALEPRLMGFEVERVRRKRPESLAAYDYMLRAQPDVHSGMPAGAARALPLLAKAIALEPGYALAHGFAAMAHHILFLRDGLAAVHREGSLRHAEAAIAYGRDEAMALTFAGFSLGMDGRDRAAAMAAFEAAITLSPSTALAHILGSVNFAWAGQAERAIAWAEHGLRLSPFDPWAFAAHHAIVLANLRLGRAQSAIEAAYRGVQANPAHSISYMLLAAALAVDGKLAEAKIAAARVMELQPGFRCSVQLDGVDCDRGLSGLLLQAGRASSLPC